MQTCSCLCAVTHHVRPSVAVASKEKDFTFVCCELNIQTKQRLEFLMDQSVMLGYHCLCYDMLTANMLSTTMTLLEKCPLVSGAILAHKPLPFSDLAALPPKNIPPPQKGLHLSQLISIILIALPPLTPPVWLTSSTLATLKLKPSPPADTSSREDSALNPPEFNPSQITVIPSPGVGGSSPSYGLGCQPESASLRPAVVRPSAGL